MTVRIGIAGLPGRMGREVSALALRDPAVTVTGGWSRGNQDAVLGVPVTSDLAALVAGCDVLIDFTSPKVSLKNLSGPVSIAEYAGDSARGCTRSDGSSIIAARLR